MNITNIEEHILGPAEHKEVAELIGSDKDELINGNKWHYVVSINSINKVVIHQATNSSEIFRVKKGFFIDEIQKMAQPKFRDLLILTTLYPLLLPEGYEIGSNSKVERNLPSKIKDLLQAGNGHLLYYHQLEILYSGLTNCSHAEAVLFRKDWNLKKEYTREVARSIQINSQTDLYGLIKRHAISDNLFFYQANYHGAYHLYEYINCSGLKSS
jgi:hypothetical protein